MTVNKTRHDILKQLATNQDLTRDRIEPVLQKITEMSAAALEVDQACIWRFTEDSRYLNCLDAYLPGQKKHQAGIILPVDNIRAYLAAIKETRYIDVIDAQTDPRVADLNQNIWRAKKVRASLQVPIRMGGTITGFIHFNQSIGTRIWTQEDITFACQIADLTTIALRDFDVKLRDRQFQTIQTVSSDVTTKTNLDQVLTQIIDHAVQMLDVNSGLLFKVNSEQRELVCTHSNNPPDGYQGLKLNFRQGVAGMVAMNGLEMVIDDYHVWSDREDVYNLKEPFTSVIAVPLQIKGRTIGVMQLMHAGGIRHFTKHEMVLLKILADMAATAMEKNRLFDMIERDQFMRTTLTRISEATAIASGVNDLLDTILDLLLPEMEVVKGAIRLNGVLRKKGFTDDVDGVIEKSLTTLVKKPDKILVVDNVDMASKTYSNLISVMKANDVHALMLTPVLQDQEQVGYICLGAPASRMWQLEEISMIEITSWILAGSARGIRHLDESRRQADFIRRMNVTNQSLTHLLTFDETVKVVGKAVMNLLAADYGMLLLRNPDNTVDCTWQKKLDDKTVNKIIADNRTIIINDFLTSKTPLFFHDIKMATMPLELRDYLITKDIVAAKILPLVYDNQTIGAVAGFYQTPQRWNEYENEIMTSFANTITLTMQNAWMYNQLEKGYLDLALSLANAMDSRETTVPDVSSKIATWAEQTAQALGCTKDEIKDICWAALLHDVGKKEVPDQVLRKPGPLTTEEWDLLRQYPVNGENIVRPLTGFRNVGAILRSYHERYDGSGYPDKRKSDDIPLGARILAVADAFNSMVDHRPYRKAMSHQEAVNELTRNSGTQFDPTVVKAFLQTVQVEVN
jgi:HD-GYP domain-containing protein (c-di-GMP phosphodiesterase class II)